MRFTKFTPNEEMVFEKSSDQFGHVKLTRDKAYGFMLMAYHQGRFSKATKLKVGTLIINNKLQIIGTGYNGSPSGVDNLCENPKTNKTFDYVIHSELNAVLNATTNDLDDCMVFVTDSPCLKCSAVLLQKGIKEVFYLRPYRSSEGINFLENHGVSTYQLDSKIFEKYLENEL